MGVDVATRTRVVRVIGKPALTAVEIEKHRQPVPAASSNATPSC